MKLDFSDGYNFILQRIGSNGLQQENLNLLFRMN